MRHSRIRVLHQSRGFEEMLGCNENPVNEQLLLKKKVIKGRRKCFL